MRVTARVALVLLGLTLVSAVRNGDEVFAATNKTGNFYVFADNTIHVIDPLSLKVVKNITKDQDGNNLVATSPDAVSGNAPNKTCTWNDAVYLEDKDKSLYYVFVNEGDTYTDAAGNPFSYITVIDTLKQQIVARLKTDARLVHMYAIQQTKEIWAHSDYAGTFTVVSIDTANKLDTVIPKFVTRPGHGKLLVDDSLFPIAYSSNVAEAYIGKFNLTSQRRIGAFAYNSSNAAAPTNAQCGGTHALVYSSANKHAYFECSGGGKGVLEWNTVKDEVVAYHPSVIGYLSAAPADDYILATDGTGSAVTVLVPGVNGKASKVGYNISVPGMPARAPVYYSNSSSATATALEDYLLFFPLYRDTNINNIAAARKAGGDVTDPTYLTKPIDCQYAPAVQAQSIGTATPGLQLQMAGGVALTPACGSCAAGVSPGNASQWNASLSGFGLTSFKDVVAANKTRATAVTTLIPAGSTATVPNAAATANQCSYSSEGNRDADRGGPYIATVADFPQPSLYIVDATATGGPAVAGYVQTSLNPRKTVWVPYRT